MSVSFLILVGFLLVAILVYKRIRAGRSEYYWVTMDAPANDGRTAFGGAIQRCHEVDGIVNGRQLAAFLRRGYELKSCCRVYKADIVQECTVN